VLDSHRGIYFGYLAGDGVSEGGNAVLLTGARHCWYYSMTSGHEGAYGLATSGQGPGSKIGPRVTMTVRDVSKIVEVAPEAVERWEAATWSK